MSSRIIDIRPRAVPTSTTPSSSLRDDILAGLSKPSGQRTLPTMLLYDEIGLRLYDAITVNAPEYYLFGAEENILKTYARDEIVPTILKASSASNSSNSDSISVVELGAGALRKTSIILDALAGHSSEAAPLTYYALDLEERELHRTIEELDVSIGKALKGKVETKGLAGTFDDGIRWILEGGLRGPSSGEPTKNSRPLTRVSPPLSTHGSSDSSDSVSAVTTPPSTPGDSHAPVHILFLGSSLGNFPRGDDAAFLKSLPLRAGSGDTLLIGLDQDNDAEDIRVAYNDPQGHTHRFIMNGLLAAGRELGDKTIFDPAKWDYVNRYDKEHRRHEAFVTSNCDQVIRDPATGQEFSLSRGEMVEIEHSHKFSDKDAHTLFTEAELRPIQRWTDSSNRYSMWLLERPPFRFSLLKTPTNAPSPFGLPSMGDWESMWAAWDFITLRMIPSNMLFEKPINLRHICLFYLGHIPTFLDIHMSRLLQEPHSDPVYFKDIFERGIDPNVDDPTRCHSHSEVPQCEADWPSLETILEFRDAARARVAKLYREFNSGQRQVTRRIARVLAMTLEHEAWHAETLLYMLLQRAGTGTIPPPEFVPPTWSALSRQWSSEPRPASPTVTLGPADVTLGHHDFEADDSKLEMAGDLTSFEYGWDNESPKRTVQVNQFKVEWRPITNGEFFEFWQTRQEEVLFPKSWSKEGDEVQVRTLYGPVSMDVAKEWPVMTDYNGLAAYAKHKGGRIPTEAELHLFKDTYDVGYEGGANVGFRNWHPLPASTGIDKNAGRGHNGGVWEWTSTVFDAYDGFVPSVLYPGYSADFFDGCHNVVIGGSYATIPRLSERKSVRNTYQRNYGYAWVGARVAYDV